jgi:hypothetical protein
MDAIKFFSIRHAPISLIYKPSADTGQTLEQKDFLGQRQVIAINSNQTPPPSNVSRQRTVRLLVALYSMKGAEVCIVGLVKKQYRYAQSFIPQANLNHSTSNTHSYQQQLQFTSDIHSSTRLICPLHYFAGSAIAQSLCRLSFQARTSRFGRIRLRIQQPPLSGDSETALANRPKSVIKTKL